MVSFYQPKMTVENSAVLTEKPIKIQLSDTVTFQYFEHDGKRIGEGLVASDRWYPGILIDHKFLFGLHQDDRFIPGIVWCGRFIPGLLTQHSFLPGLVLENRFVPGIVATGAFIPGVCKGNNFVPGIVSESHFIPGFFMTDGKFVPGRYLKGRFEAGVWNKGTFVASDYTKIPAADAYALEKEGYGLPSPKRFDAVGGFPIRGMIYGAFGETFVYVDHGLLSDEGAVIGGLWNGENLSTVDPIGMLKKELGIGPLGELGQEFSGLDKQYEDLEKWAEQFMEGINDPFGMAGWWGAAFGAGNPPDFASALNILEEGNNAFIEGLNKDYDDYWKSFLDSNAGGMITEGGGWKKAKEWGGYVGAGAGAVIGGVIGAAGGVIGAAEGAGAGYAAGLSIGKFVVDAAQWVYENIFGGSSDEPKEEKPKDGSDKPKPGSSALGEPGEEGDPNYAYHQPRGFEPMHIENRHQLVVTLSENNYSETVGSLNQKKGVITFVSTDTGPRAIVNWSELKRMMARSGVQPKVIGVNPLTGDLITYKGKPLTSEEARQQKVAAMMESIIHKDPGHPLK